MNLFLSAVGIAQMFLLVFGYFFIFVCNKCRLNEEKKASFAQLWVCV